jgi:oxygen-independent coproporphyrinogen III oxidase
MMRQNGHLRLEVDQDQRFGIAAAATCCKKHRSIPSMTPRQTAELSEAVPRYTSYPTAPHFHAGVDGATYHRWLDELNGEAISLYVHIPYCDRLCWFCACHTKMTRHYEPVAEYLGSLYREIEAVGAAVRGKASVQAVHFGGGSPTMLRPEDVVALDARLRGSFDYRADIEISVEIEPNDMDEARFDALSAIGMTRASLGVQDFEPRVQAAINREQSFELTRSVVEGVRARGVHSVNLDLLYGLPHQTCDSVAATVERALSLRPDRIAFFGYAHVPWFKKHQTMIDEAWLPGPQERLAQSRLAGELVAAHGYQRIGIDHFALPDDSLAVAARTGRLRRNFQGYTDDRCETLIGLGPSAVSRLPQGYAQNTAATGEYERLVGQSGVATGRGIALSGEDRMRGWVIERLMCDFAFSRREAVERFGDAAEIIIAEARDLTDCAEGLLIMDGGDMFVVSPERRPLVRTIAAKFDGYLAKGGARHSAAV